MSPTTDPNYFGKSALSDLKSVADAARKVMQGETQKEVKEEKPKRKRRTKKAKPEPEPVEEETTEETEE